MAGTFSITFCCSQEQFLSLHTDRIVYPVSMLLMQHIPAHAESATMGRIADMPLIDAHVSFLRNVG